MNRNQISALGVLLIGILTLAVACGGVQDRAEKVKELTSVIDSLETSYTSFSSINTDQLQAISDTIQVHLSDIQRLYAGEQKRELADPLSRYRAILKLLPDAAKRGKKVHDEYGKTRQQLMDLRDAIVGGATVDAVGNKIDEAYVSKAMKEEGDVARLLLSEMQQIADRAVQVHEQYALYFPVARQVVDSLRSLPVVTK